jgi:hypothetical protein
MSEDDYQRGFRDGRAKERRISALKLADELNDLVHPLLMRYIEAMQKLSELAERPLHSALPGGPVIAEGPLPRHEEAAEPPGEG